MDIHEEEHLGKLYDAQLARRLFAYLKPYRKYFLTSIVLITLTSAIELSGLNITMVVVDLYLKPRPAEELSLIARTVANISNQLNWQPSIPEALTVFSAIYLLVIIVVFALSYFQDVLLNTMGQYVMYDLRKEIFSHLQRLPLSYFDRNPVGRLVTRLTSDVDALNELMTAGFATLFSDVFMLLGIIVFLFLVNWQLALALLCILPLMIAITAWFRRNATRAFRTVRVKLARINSFLQEHITGMAVVQIFNREEKAYREFAKIDDEHRKANIDTIFYYAVFYPAVGLINAIGIALIIWYGGLQVLEGTLTLGALIFFIQATHRFYEPIQDISEKYNILQSAVVASERIFKLLDLPISITSPANPQKLGKFKSEIEFRNVWFAYEDENWVLKGVSFKIAAGESVALIGHTGAGKTTIVNLLLRFYDVQKGQILIDGHDIRELDIAELRSQFALVLQDVFLFSGDVKTNITLGNDAISKEKIIEAARQVHADTFINRLDGGYDAPLTERGSTLSAGQRQLLSFARALSYDPNILILDEATSSVDTETEMLIQDAVGKLLQGRTSIIIAHRLSTIQKCNRIIVLHKGKVREIGTHQQLDSIKYRLTQSLPQLKR
ncbi:MAG: ABC transporter ATP-binding protein [Acidobacteriota bacterium]|nr:ABC transporter ATP-binding protein/permease [Blastocatellia bacterium]MDW8413514.1 ABC transporter ATP-binding protein [Acidobacteriota bacterium]